MARAADGTAAAQIVDREVPRHWPRLPAVRPPCRQARCPLRLESSPGCRGCWKSSAWSCTKNVITTYDNNRFVCSQTEQANNIKQPAVFTVGPSSWLYAAGTAACGFREDRKRNVHFDRLFRTICGVAICDTKPRFPRISCRVGQRGMRAPFGDCALDAVDEARENKLLASLTADDFCFAQASPFGH